MNFVDAVKKCLTQYANFSGRAARPEFWWFALFGWVVSALLASVSANLSGIFSLAILIPNLAVGARRLHDTDRSGWWQLIGLTGIGLIVLIVFWATEGKEPNRFGGKPAA